MTGLFYDVRGTGPVLLVLPGGAGHPMGLDGLTERLARRFTVVTYDPLGLAHGRLGHPVADQRVERWSEGARRVLDAVLPRGERAFVLGTSSGGIAALDLLARHPGRLRHVVAHEAPCVAVLPDGARQGERFRQVYAAYRAAGPRAAGARLTDVLGGREPGVVEAGAGQPLSRAEELSSPMALFLAHVLVPFTSYVPSGLYVAQSPPVASASRAPESSHMSPASRAPDADPADPAGARLTSAAGAGSRGLLLHRTAARLAERTGGTFAEFPGGHLGAAEHPEAFALRLEQVLGV
ncbi:alpha/beta fold hydrolase [Streptomyces sp. NPDC005526]|uniref:alpha/beta fold hydrolase n=1 Tax=Streptomyces sp. NPDC005526 TaxID=3156885 RepID=UPI0033B2E3E9